MNVDDLREYYQASSDKELAKIIQRVPSTICQWRKEGLPERTQGYFQAITNGALVADIASPITINKPAQTKTPAVT